jgi:phosphonopyruvate decarboxylase
MRIVEGHRGGALVITCHSSRPVWRQVSRDEEMDIFFTGCMGKESSLALGLALSSSRKVILFDGDGSLLMNLGSLVTIAGRLPENLYHFLVRNGVYATTGGQPIPGQGKVDFAGLAREAGYPRVYEFDNLEDLASRIGEVLGGRGPVLVSLQVEPEVGEPPGIALPRRRMAEVFAELRARLERKGAGEVR